MSGGTQYPASWLRGVGYTALDNLIDDAVTAEISRSRMWQWVRHGAGLREGVAVIREPVGKLEENGLGKLREALGEKAYGQGRYEEAADVLRPVAPSREFVEFLTLPAYERVECVVD